MVGRCCMIRIVLWVLLIPLLVGCNTSWPGGGSADNGVGGGHKAAGTLTKTDSAGLLAYFREVVEESEGRLEWPTPAVVMDDVSVGGATQSNVSGTNLQVAGVDEADLLKTASDGRLLYAIYEHATPVTLPLDGERLSQTAGAGIRIMRVEDSGTLSELSRLPFDSDGLHQRGLYLDEVRQRLIAVDQSSGAVYANWFAPEYFLRQRTRLRIIDVTDPTRPAVVRQLGFDGALVASRRVENVVYLILRHVPEIGADAAALRVDALLPRYRIDGVDGGLLVSPEDCYLNRSVAQKRSDVIVMVAVDLASDGADVATRCYVGSSEALYASASALYLASTRYPYRILADGIAYEDHVTTDIHKFAFDGLSIDYRGSAEAEGHLGWKQDQKSFRFSESADGHLRVITYREPRRFVVQPVDVAVADEPVASSGAGGSPVMLTIFKESASRQALEVVSTLPNARRPAPLGRPGEQLYGTRYVGDRAYLITFRVTDPLYVVDLSDPADPYIAGELKISGYSDYLHPVTETLLLGIGKEAVPARTSGGDFGGAWYQGIKLSLIDVSDPARPLEVDRVEIGKRGTDSAALHDHHAITTLKVGERLRLALPIALHDRPSKYGDPIAPSYYYDYTHTGLYRFEVDPVARKIDTAIEPLIVADRRSATSWEGGTRNDRSAIIGDHVHYLHNGRFWSQRWRGGVVTGPE